MPKENTFCPVGKKNSILNTKQQFEEFIGKFAKHANIKETFVFKIEFPFRTSKII